MFRQLWNDQAGVILSAELVLILTLAVLAMIVGLSEVAVSVNEELNDISNAIGNLNQSYYYTGFVGEDNYSWKDKSYVAGSRFDDEGDSCDKNETVISCRNPDGECGY